MDFKDRYDSLLQYWAAQFNLDWKMVKAQMLAESAADPKARSSAGACGLMQFMPATWAEWGRGEDIFNPEASIRSGCAYMRWLTEQLTEYDMALAAYNWGIGNLKRAVVAGDWRGRLPQETATYLKRIHGYRGQWT